MLSACLGSASVERGAANPVVETRRELLIVCPADLANPPAARPAPAADAIIEYNPAGRDHLAALIAWGGSLFDIIIDARSQCPDTAGPGVAP